MKPMTISLETMAPVKTGIAEWLTEHISTKTTRLMVFAQRSSKQSKCLTEVTMQCKWVNSYLVTESVEYYSKEFCTLKPNWRIREI